MSAARQWRLVWVLTGGAGHKTIDERADGPFGLSETRLGRGSVNRCLIRNPEGKQRGQRG